MTSGLGFDTYVREEVREERVQVKKPHVILIMTDQHRGDATASAPKPTWDRPSPIMEYRFKTRLTPRSAAQRDTSRPTMSARTMNV